MFAVVHGLVEELGHVVVVEAVDDAAPSRTPVTGRGCVGASWWETADVPSPLRQRVAHAIAARQLREIRTLGVASAAVWWRPARRSRRRAGGAVAGDPVSHDLAVYRASVI
ncbi:hypothetical protein SAMN04489793_0001 [Tsukamurella tyrosinosolvens]|uniref:Uncharacterized protein n=1 Tax=Tsukamurella tyrosinosolvens TaxID=57704 RepID=A0A1H4I5T4_TSUTY|nr:hypothetical protein SAMN04489793_0001 [Tsukamurella tyrosinosolvens]